MSARTARLANGLAKLGVGKGTKVAVILTNRAQYVEIVYAVAGLGAAVVPISYRFTPGEIAYAVRHSDAEVVIVDGHLTGTFAAAHETLTHIPADHVLVVGGELECTGYLDYETVLAGSSTQLDYLNMDEWDVYHLAFTGGTSGAPKACEIPQRIARQGWYDITVEVGNRANDVTVIAGPFYHGLGFTWGLQQLMVGGTIVLLREFDARELLRTIERERVSFIPMVPTMFEMLLEVPDKASFDTTSVRRLMSAGLAAAHRDQGAAAGVLSRRGALRALRLDRGGVLQHPQAGGPAPQGALGGPAVLRVRAADPRSRRRRRAGGNGGADLQAGTEPGSQVLQEPGGHRGPVPWRVDLERGPRSIRRGGLPLRGRPGQGHDHLGRGEHLPDRDRGRARQASRTSSKPPSSAAPTPNGARSSPRTW